MILKSIFYASLITILMGSFGFNVEENLIKMQVYFGVFAVFFGAVFTPLVIIRHHYKRNSGMGLVFFYIMLAILSIFICIEFNQIKYGPSASYSLFMCAFSSLAIFYLIHSIINLRLKRKMELF